MQKRVLHQTPIEDTALFAPGAISPHLEEHSYPHAGQSKDGLFSSNEESSYRGGSGAGQHTKDRYECTTVYNTNIPEGPGWVSNQNHGLKGYLPMALFAFEDAIHKLFQAP